MTIAGWIIMLSSISFVVGLLAFCFYKVFSVSDHPEDQMHAPLDIDTHDQWP